MCVGQRWFREQESFELDPNGCLVTHQAGTEVGAWGCASQQLGRTRKATELPEGQAWGALHGLLWLDWGLP